jgi:hypothetical protein
LLICYIFHELPTGESDGSISLESLAKGEDIEGYSPLNLEDMAWLIARGGWPAAVTWTDYQTTNQTAGVISLATDYVESIIESDSSHVDGIEKTPDASACSCDHWHATNRAKQR